MSIKNGNQKLKGDRHFGFKMSLPAIIVLGCLYVFPIIYSFCASFTDYRLVGHSEISFIGFENYLTAFKDSNFINSLKVTAMITIGALLVEFIVAFLISGIVINVKKGQSIFKTIYLIPMMVSPTVAGLLFRFMLNDDFGLMNTLLKNLGVISKNIPWLTDNKWGIVSIIYVDSWLTIPFIFLLLYTGLSSVSDDVVESARIDGASRFQIYWKIQIPIVKPTVMVALLIRFMDLFRIYDAIYVLTKGGPGKATESLSLLIYRMNWNKYKVGYASALSYLMLVIMVVVSILIQKGLSDNDDIGSKRKRGRRV